MASTIGAINPFRYRGYYYDTETGLYYLNSRYYDPETGRFINADSLEYLGANGDFVNYNLFAYCGNNPTMHIDKNGNFAITIGSLLVGLLVGALAGATVSFGSTVYEDYKDDGEIFNGSVGIDEYIGNTAGGAIAGAGIGLCTVLGAGCGVAAIAGETLFIGSFAISGYAALGIGMSAAFSTGALGYVTRTAFNSKEEFDTSDMFVEAGANAISGLISFAGGFVGGYWGIKVPGTGVNVKNIIKYQLGMSTCGPYFLKILLSQIKKQIKEVFND